jgi:hypothetical protein
MLPYVRVQRWSYSTSTDLTSRESHGRCETEVPTYYAEDSTNVQKTQVGLSHPSRHPKGGAHIPLF